MRRVISLAVCFSLLAGSAPDYGASVGKTAVSEQVFRVQALQPREVNFLSGPRVQKLSAFRSLKALKLAAHHLLHRSSAPLVLLTAATGAVVEYVLTFAYPGASPWSVFRLWNTSPASPLFAIAFPIVWAWSMWQLAKGISLIKQSRYLAIRLLAKSMIGLAYFFLLASLSTPVLYLDHMFSFKQLPQPTAMVQLKRDLGKLTIKELIDLSWEHDGVGPEFNYQEVGLAAKLALGQEVPGRPVDLSATHHLDRRTLSAYAELDVVATNDSDGAAKAVTGAFLKRWQERVAKNYRYSPWKLDNDFVTLLRNAPADVLDAVLQGERYASEPVLTIKSYELALKEVKRDLYKEVSDELVARQQPKMQESDKLPVVLKLPNRRGEFNAMLLWGGVLLPLRRKKNKGRWSIDGDRELSKAA